VKESSLKKDPTPPQTPPSPKDEPKVDGPTVPPTPALNIEASPSKPETSVSRISEKVAVVDDQSLDSPIKSRMSSKRTVSCLNKKSECNVFVPPKVKRLREVQLIQRVKALEINRFEQQLYRNYYPTFEPNRKQA
jgi:hypothetical protein